MPARTAAPKRKREQAESKPAPTLARSLAKAKPTKRAEKPAAEARPLSKVARESIQLTMDAHALLRDVGAQIEQQMRRHPMQGTPTGVAKCPSIEMPMSRELYEHSRIARGKDKAAWVKVVNSKAEAIRKRSLLKKAKAKHQKALGDEGARRLAASWLLVASPARGSPEGVLAARACGARECGRMRCACPTRYRPHTLARRPLALRACFAAVDGEEDEEDFEAMPEARKAKYMAAAKGGKDDDEADDDDNAGVPVVERLHKCTCTDPEVNHRVLALAPQGLRLGACVTMHGRQAIFASISKLCLNYSLADETLTASCEVSFQQHQQAAKPHPKVQDDE
jgi:hypothetical protein